jgi:hypothetical protein
LMPLIVIVEHDGIVRQLDDGSPPRLVPMMIRRTLSSGSASSPSHFMSAHPWRRTNLPILFAALSSRRRAP